MKVGDLVTALDADRGIGIIKGITYDHKGMSLRVSQSRSSRDSFN